MTSQLVSLPSILAPGYAAPPTTTCETDVKTCR
jgi:hypothetical protein